MVSRFHMDYDDDKDNTNSFSSVYPSLISEFTGTYLLVLTIGCNALVGSPIWSASSIGCFLMVAVYALGPVSGAHFNPAVTFAICLVGRMDSWFQAAQYIVVQLVAGFLAAMTYVLVLGKALNLQPGKGYGWLEASLVEMLYTWMLCFVVLNVVCCQANQFNQYHGLAIGFVIIAAGHTAGPISGGALNPAVAFGIDVSSAGLGFGWCFVYLAAEIAGAALAALSFRIVRAEEWGAEWPAQWLRRATSEFIGTFFLVLTVGLNVLAHSPAAAWSIACSLMCVIYALGSCSGAHFNPAVTTAILFSGRAKIDLKEAGIYVACQIISGVCAGFVYSFVHGQAMVLSPGEQYTWVQCAIAEIIFTFVLCSTVLHCCTTEDSESIGDFGGLAVGMSVAAGGYAIGHISGGSLNPAVSIGVDWSHAVWKSSWIPWNSIAYSLFELGGAILASVAFYFLRPSEYAKGITGKALPCRDSFQQRPSSASSNEPYVIEADWWYTDDGL
eukprot:gnl/MRDRNA2_/MRDRNA2_114486_c0_seq1.p1 gnl/MRDRNA2_/MRDRNA2_114486_c0~~gnl/MRDRNA2_/MRDRNA2_114486_c0_seq1.p1  ORF type:complete len:499 (+),score=62.48 gnl/MRDRNA2_/MRDRNA2_114486_c0_seq1:104-1600(+)